MIKRRNIVLLLLSCLVFPAVTYANMVWPALYAETKISSIPIILLSLILEFIFFKWLFQINIKKAIYYTVIANIASGTLGYFLRPILGLAYELTLGGILDRLFRLSTFNPIGWFVVPLIGGAINALLELLTIRSIWKHKINKRNYFLTWVVNFVTVGIATVWVILQKPDM
jgi:hypothetical protein